ncbi:MAG TPA: carboxylesterase family protein [Bacteroidales bacterium]|nr:carboxylesterase family protein [Bacteroidales bacterium]
MNKTLCFLTIPFLLAASPADKKTDLNKVMTEAGYVSGKTSEDGKISIFMGVPFAAPPVGELRWKAPQPVKAWTGIKQCTTPPPSAMQAPPRPFMMWSQEFMAPAQPLSEDCLYLNIWTGTQNANEKRPVMVWIHGGAFTGGSGTVPLYDGEEMARKGVIFVTINYRLGVFGFLAHPELTAESQLKTSGNYGILDQIEALKWIRKNIASFGGNPDNVTIAGQSAGSFSVNALMVSPLAKGLFHKAIGQSGGMFSNGLGIVYDLKAAEASGLKYSEQLKANSIKDLRAKSADELMKIQGRWGIAIDGIVVPPAQATFDGGKQSDVPLISGWNADDGVSTGQQKAEVFKASIRKNYGDNADEYLNLFPAGNDEEAEASQKLGSQLSFGWQNYHWAGMQTKTGKNKAYLYLFSRVPPGEPDYGAFHSAEFGYALHNLKKWDRPFTDVDKRLSDMMSSYWANFAKNGDPNGEGLPQWPAFDNSSPKIMNLGNSVEAGPLPNREQLQFLERINTVRPWLSMKELSSKVWVIDDHGDDNMYLVEGSDSAMLIDNGLGSANISAFVKRVTSKPLIVVITHGHPDHAGGNYQFPAVYIHPADSAAASGYNTPAARKRSVESMQQGNKPAGNEIFTDIPFKTRQIPISEGKIFDLGGRRIRVIETPGHTPGEICLLDIDNKLLFTGDNNNGLVWLFLGNCLPLSKYLLSLEKEALRMNEFTTIFPGHGDPMPADFINDQISCVKGILNKTIESKPYESFVKNSRISTYGRASVTFNPENL